MSKRGTLWLVAALAANAAAVLGMNRAVAGIAGSAHDFSSAGWSAGSVCEACHTPHNADASVASAPLWNHQVTSAVFTVYSSPTMDAPVEQPRGPSKLCLSCHDGTVAVDSFGGTLGTVFMAGRAALGTKLSNDHPISVAWHHQTLGGEGDCMRCHIVHPWGFNTQVPFFDGYVECPSCHDVHAGLGYPTLLRDSMDGSSLCLHCHHDK